MMSITLLYFTIMTVPVFFNNMYVFSIFVGRWLIYILNLFEILFSYACYNKLQCYLFRISLIALKFIAGPVHKQEALGFSPGCDHELSVCFSFTKLNLDFRVRKEIMTPKKPFFDRWLVNIEWYSERVRAQRAEAPNGPAKTGGCRIARRKRQ